MGQTNHGIASIGWADVPADGAMPTSFAPYGLTEEDSFSWNTKDAEFKELKTEEKGTIDEVLITGEELGFTLTIANPDIDILVALKGGTKTGTGSNAKWTPPAIPVTIKKAAEIMPWVGLGFRFLPMSLSTKWTDKMGKNNFLGLVVTAKFLPGDDNSKYEVFNK